MDVWGGVGFSADPFPVPPARAARILPGAIGRLKRGVSLEQAQSRLDAMSIALADEFPTRLSEPAALGAAHRARPVDVDRKRTPDAHHPAGRGELPAIDRLRERGRPHARALIHAHARLRAAPGARRLSRKNCATAAHRERAHLADRRGRCRPGTPPITRIVARADAE